MERDRGAFYKASQRSRRLEHGQQLALGLQGDDAGPVVAAPDALAADEDIGHGGAPRQLCQLSAYKMA